MKTKLLALVVLLTLKCHAGIAEFVLSGYVITDDSLIYKNGNPFSFNISYETEQTGLYIPPYQGVFYTQYTGTGTFNYNSGEVLVTDPNLIIRVYNDVPNRRQNVGDPLRDTLSFYFDAQYFGEKELPSAEMGVFDATSLKLSLYDYDGDAINSEALPESLELQEFELKPFANGTGSEDGYVAYASPVQSLGQYTDLAASIYHFEIETITTVPEHRNYSLILSFFIFTMALRRRVRTSPTGQ